MLRPRALLLPLVIALFVAPLAACSSMGNAETGNARSRAQEFVRSVDADPAAACALLAPETRRELEDTQGPCDSALPGEDVGSDTDVTSVDVYGKDAVVHLADDTVFLARFRAGWLVTAAGCTPQQDKPYDCAVKGS